MQTIQLINLSYMLIPCALVLLVMRYWSLSVTTSLYALARMVLQLCLIGYVLAFVFDTSHNWVVLLALTCMLLISSWISLRTLPKHRAQLYWRALAAVSVVNVLLLLLVTQWVLNVTPWFKPSVVIPLAGMLFSSGMTSISIALERYSAELHNKTNIQNASKRAYSATMIPTVNSLFAVGLVALPGMMTGQILSGVSPLIAARYQIMVMAMLFSSAGLTSLLFLFLVRRKPLLDL